MKRKHWGQGGGREFKGEKSIVKPWVGFKLKKGSIYLQLRCSSRSVFPNLF